MKNLRVKAEIRPMWGFYKYDDFTTHVLCLALVPYLTFRFIWTKKGTDWMSRDFVKEWFDKQSKPNVFKGTPYNANESVYINFINSDEIKISGGGEINPTRGDIPGLTMPEIHGSDFCDKKSDGYCACNKECGDFELTK